MAEKIKDSRPEIRREALLALGAIGEAAAPAVPQIAGALSDEHTRIAATFVLGQIGQIPADVEATIQANAKAVIPADTKGDNRPLLLKAISLWALARVHPEDKDLRREVTEQLIAQLKNPNEFAHVMAASALAALPPAPEITLPIWEKALKDADETTVRHALDALAAIGPPAVPHLTAALKNTKFRAEVAYVLGRFGPPAAPATDALAQLVEDKDTRTAQEAVIALANIGPGANGAVPALVKALQNPSDGNANLAGIIYALGKIGPAAAEAKPALLGILSGQDRALALDSAWALARIEPGSAEMAAKVVPVLVAGLSAPLPLSRQSAAEALGGLGSLAKDAAPALEKAAKDQDAGVRNAAAKALAAVQQGAVQPAPGPVKPAEPGPAKPLAYRDAVVTIEDGVGVMVGEAVTARVPKGTQFKVLEVRAPWVGVKGTVDGKSVTGWVLQTQIGRP